MSADHNDAQKGTPSTQSALRQSLHEIIDPFKSLATSPRALWGVYISYLLEGLVYFGILTILGKYLSENVGLADLHAGWVYSGFTGGITLAMLFLGGVADRIGVRRAMLLSLGMMILGRTMLGASGTFFEQGAGPGSPMFFAVILGLFIVVLGYGTYQPAAYSAVKRFTTKRTASMGYAMIYGLMNLGAFFSGIISPPIRKSLGIESVYWVYSVVTVLAFLTVLFIMTRKVVERDTLTRIDVDEAENDVNNDTPAKPSTPQAKLLTPTFLALILASVASVVIIISMVLTAEPGPGQQPLRDIKYEMQRLDLALGDADPAGGQQMLILAAADEIDALAVGTHAPADLAADRTVDKRTFTLANTRLGEATTLMRDFASQADLSTKFHLESADSTTVIGGLRTLGLTYMATAYSVVSPVDDAVLENLRNRIKEPGAEAPDPLTAEQRTRIMRLVELDPAAQAALLAEVTRETRQNIAAAGPYGRLFDALLKGQVVSLDRLGALAQGTDADATESVADLLKDHLLEAAVFYTADMPDLVKTGTGYIEAEKSFFQKILGFIGAGKEASEPVPATFSTLDVFTTWMGSEMAAIDHLDSAVGGAVKLPNPEAFTNWAKRYGVWLLAAVVFLLLLGGNMLSKRPEHPFHDKRFVFFIFILIPVQTLFAHNWLTLPYYINRAFGGTTVGENFEFFSNLNPILIFFLAPMVAALTVKAKVYPMMIWGTLVMAAPTFLLTLPPAPVFLLTYILLMSIGEAMWQPRFLQWVAEIAPEGQTGTYMGIGQFPWFLTKVLTGLYSGYFLSQYCPVVGPQNTQFMWLIYALIAMFSPVALILARGWMMKGMKTANNG